MPRSGTDRYAPAICVHLHTLTTRAVGSPREPREVAVTPEFGNESLDVLQREGSQAGDLTSVLFMSSLVAARRHGLQGPAQAVESYAREEGLEMSSQ